ncbi:MAG TPA: anthranilate synthase component I [Anaerolineales bacterium]|nr:anthranilate synthase component I [Anaerolineales bacterium]
MSSHPVKTLNREIHADLETPISVYLKVRGNQPSFLLESIDGGEIVARYSFIGTSPLAQYILYTDRIEVIRDGSITRILLAESDDPFSFLEKEMENFQVEPPVDLPRFNGGMVGYLAYEMVQYFEPSLKGKIPLPSSPIGHFLLTDTVIAFDHARRSLQIITHLFDGNENAGIARLDNLQALIQSPFLPQPEANDLPDELVSNLSRADFENNVQAAKEHIEAGDIFQVVLSQRLCKVSNANPFTVYRNLRRLNPSPYMYFLDFGRLNDRSFNLVGASPEMLVRLEGSTISLRPIAGTRKRGKSPSEDDNLARELKNDPKENAEHVMLVDLGRNDLGRVSEYGSVKVTDLAVIEKYSHVMHLVSNLTAKLKTSLNAFDLVRATFPAGTVSGAPKVKAIEIIGELEGKPRGAYAGMVGYFGFDGAMDGCITIRTLIVEGNTFCVQAGAGVVADSNPSSEYQETINKAKAILRAIEMTEENI